jgi:acyl-CoA synthetase (AMP-forming)/AMP-acid ligase II
MKGSRDQTRFTKTPRRSAKCFIKGAVVFAGITRNPEATADRSPTTDGFRSGDLGEFDNDGNLYIVGRAKDVIVLPSGKECSSRDLEIHYLKTPLVEEMAVIGVADPVCDSRRCEKARRDRRPGLRILKREKVANSKKRSATALTISDATFPSTTCSRLHDPRGATSAYRQSKDKTFRVEEGLRRAAYDRSYKTRRSRGVHAEDQCPRTPGRTNVVSIIQVECREKTKARSIRR